MATGKSYSKRTWAVLILGVVAAVTVQLLVMSGVGGEFVSTAISDIGGVLIIGTAAAVIIRTAMRFGKGEPLRRQWLAIGIGVMLYALGDVVWTYIELVQRAEVPYPGLPDVMYAALYLFLGYGIVSAAYAYRELVKIKTPLIVSVVVTAVTGALLYVVLVRDIIADPSVGLLEKLLDLYYPVADLALLLGPAIFIVLVVAQLGRGMLAAPWRFVMAGASILAIADTTYQWLEWQELYAAGHIVDLGWMLGYVLIAVGASIMRDLILPDPSGRPRP